MSIDYGAIARALGSERDDVRLIAVAYLGSAPDGVERFTGTMPSSCSFWSLAAHGKGFYTVPADHHNCPIGAYTNGIDLPADRQPELEQTLTFMANIGYVRMEEVPSIPRLARPAAFTYYAPLATAAVDPDVVIAAGRPGHLMRVQEAATRAGAASSLPLLGRPTCMALPAAIANGSVMSSGCIGNRVYTGLGDDELYLMLPGNRIGEIAGAMQVIDTANETLAQFHRDRRQKLTS